MNSLQGRMIVAENCLEYKPKPYRIINIMSSISQDCSYCTNYKNGKCNKELFEEIEGKIRIN